MSILNNIRWDYFRFVDEWKIELWVFGFNWLFGLVVLLNGKKLQSIKVFNDDLN